VVGQCDSDVIAGFNETRRLNDAGTVAKHGRRAVVVATAISARCKPLSALTAVYTLHTLLTLNFPSYLRQLFTDFNFFSQAGSADNLQ